MGRNWPRGHHLGYYRAVDFTMGGGEAVVFWDKVYWMEGYQVTSGEALTNSVPSVSTPQPRQEWG